MLTASVSIPAVASMLSSTSAGPVPDLNAIDVADMVATVDLAGLEAGEHVISVTIEAPPGTTLVSITPAEVEVTLRPS